MKRFLILVSVLAAATPLRAQSVGEQLFMNNCIACHGVTGHGDGPQATHLKTRPADLTQIAARRDGVWPMLEVMSILDGYMKVTNPREDMPVFEDFLDNDMVEFDTGNGLTTMVPAKLIEVATYLETIQNPAPTRYVP